MCVEEQFYIFCPMLIAFVPAERRVRVVVGLMLLGVVGRAITAMALEQRVVTPVFFQWSTITQLDTLLSGVLLALLRERFTRMRDGSGRFVRASNRPDTRTAWSQTIGKTRPRTRLGRGSRARFRGHLGRRRVRSVDRGDELWVRLPCPELSGRIVWLGRISYGLYMYHEIAFFLQRKLYEFVGWFPFQEAVAPLVSIALTVGLAAASYNYVEQQFLRKKMRWSRVKSRPI